MLVNSTTLRRSISQSVGNDSYRYFSVHGRMPKQKRVDAIWQANHTQIVLGRGGWEGFAVGHGYFQRSGPSFFSGFDRQGNGFISSGSTVGGRRGPACHSLTENRDHFWQRIRILGRPRIREFCLIFTRRPRPLPRLLLCFSEVVRAHINRKATTTPGCSTSLSAKFHPVSVRSGWENVVPPSFRSLGVGISNGQTHR